MLAPLLVRSSYSFHRGTASPTALAGRAKELGWGALGLADRLGVHGYPVFTEACAEAGLKAVLGVELPAPGGRTLLVAETREGLARLTRLLSDREGRPFEPRRELREALPGLSLASEDPGLLSGLDRGWRAYALLSPCNRGRWRSLRSAGWPLLATGEAAFLEKRDRDLERLLLAIGRKATIHDVEEGDLSPAEALLLGPEGFRRCYEEVPEALRENEALVERAAVSSLFDGFVFPRYAAEEGAAVRLRTLVLEGARGRYGEVLPEKALSRIDYELAIIEEKDFADYFLVVRDIVRRVSRTCGRGSAAASIVSYSLGITDVDPLRHDLYFERFLNPGRKDPPDIDVDFAWDERDELLAAVVEAHGELHAARVSNHVCFQPRSALRETARAFGMPEGEIAAYERGISVDAERTRSGAGAEWREIASLAARIVGFPRHLSVHSGGIVLVPDRLADHVPLERSGSGIRVTAWDKDGVEAAGLVKIDLLGNRSLAVVRDALANLAENGDPIDEASWEPIDDPETVELLARGDSMGVFYVESPAMRLLQKKTGVGDFAHLVIHSSIIRPAANAYINEYIDRLKGLKPPQLIHPRLEGLFDETFGIMCYQEDVSKAAVAMAGFTPAEADKIRKILAHKDVKTRLESYREKFYRGAAGLGVKAEDAATVWSMIESFAGYSFVKAHSASYAMLSFRSAYLRRHYPAEFMAAVMSNRGGFYSILAYASEARRMGLTLLPPDVNESELRCRGRGRVIRFGLGMIGRLGEACAKRIVGDRHRNGDYRSVADFARRIYPDREESEALIGSGALDALEPDRPRSAKFMQLLGAQVERGMVEVLGPELCGFQGTVTEILLDASSARGVLLRQDQREAERRRLEAELRYLGTTLAVHPLTLFPQALELPRLRGREIESHVGDTVQLVGWPITAKPVLTSEDEPMEFVSFEDETALYETVLFPDVYRAYRHLLFEPGPVLLRGRVEEDRGAVTLEVASIERLRSLANPRLPQAERGMTYDRSIALLETLVE